MEKLENKIKNALDEVRTLALGAQVLIGFGFNSVLQKGFDHLPQSSQYLQLLGLGLLLVSLTLLVAPCPYHRIVDKGQPRADLHAFITAMALPALLPFAAGIGLALYVTTDQLFSTAAAVWIGLTGSLVALIFWYGIEFMAIHKAGEKDDQPPPEPAKPQDQQQDVSKEVQEVLTETRVVLPGAQALLGFQFTAVLMDGFSKLPASSKTLHLVALELVCLSIILLMTPASYHRLVEHGEDTQRFVDFASRMLLCAMPPLALGMVLEFYVVLLKVSHSALLSATLSTLLFVCFFGLWFGYSLYVRARQARAGVAS